MGNNSKNLTGKKYLFLDRDGVINVHRPNDYVKSIDEFEFLPGVCEALASLSKRFNRIIIVTNQRGIEKGKMLQEDLNRIHRFLIQTIHSQGGRIDAIYICTALEDSHPCRKPNSGMALQAQKEFPEIDFYQSVMVGDSQSDILFGKQLGMVTVLIDPCCADKQLGQDYSFSSLKSFSIFLEVIIG